MAFNNTRSFWDFESQDGDCDGLVGNVAHSYTAGRQQDGNASALLDYTLAGACYIHDSLPSLGAITVPKIIVFSGAFGLDSAPSSGKTPPLLSGSLFGGAVFRPIRFNDARKLEIYDKDGNQHGPASTTLIPTSGVQEIHVVFDGKTLSTVYVKVYFGGTEELAFDTGKTWNEFFSSYVLFDFGDLLVPSGGYGCKLYVDGLVYRESGSAADAPHLVDYPRLRGNGQHATRVNGNGAHTAWGGDYQDIDDLLGHDGDTSAISNNLVKGAKETFDYSSSNPLPAGIDPDWVQLRTVAKLGDVDKLGGSAMTRLGGTDVTAPDHCTPYMSYTATIWRNMNRPGGGPWVRADAEPGTLEFGVVAFDFAAFESSALATLVPSPTWVWHTANLAAGTTPVAAPVDASRPFGSVMG